MNWIYDGFLIAAILHVLEEFVLPGGFLIFMKKMAPQIAPFATPGFAILINGLFLLLCVIGVWFGRSVPFFGLSIAALVGINGIIHTAGAVRVRGYAPGLVSGVLLYFPLAVIAYVWCLGSGRLTVGQGIGAFFLGAAFQLVPMVYLGIAYLLKRA
jgi:hypothetical protein